MKHHPVRNLLRCQPSLIADDALLQWRNFLYKNRNRLKSKNIHCSISSQVTAFSFTEYLASCVMICDSYFPQWVWILCFKFRLRSKIREANANVRQRDRCPAGSYPSCPAALPRLQQRRIGTPLQKRRSLQRTHPLKAHNSQVSIAYFCIFITIFPL